MTTATSTPLVVPESLKQQFKEDGYFILERVVPEEHLKLLRDACQHFIDKCNAEMDRQKTDVLGINHRNKRYFASMCYRQRPELGEMIFSDYMAAIATAALGPDVFLFWDQYVVKCAEVGMNFSWHQDSGYVGYPDHKPYLTCWIPLDDVREENGTVYLLPFSRSGIRTWVKHTHDPKTNDLVGYFGSDRGIPVICPAGSVVAFSSLVFHSSGANRTQGPRRVYLPQYSAERILTPDKSRNWGQSVPFMKNGHKVWKPGMTDEV